MSRASVAITAFVLMANAGCQSTGADYAGVFNGRAGKWLDLTYSFSEETIYWPTGKPFSLEQEAYGFTDKGYFYSSYNYSAAEHGGTHFDAPVHFAESGETSDQVPLTRLIGPAVVVDVTHKVHADYQAEVLDLLAWESRHGPMPEGAIVLFRTGWGARWPDRSAFLGTDLTGPEAVAELHFPGIGADAARWLVDKGTVAAIGIDTPSIDYGQSSEYDTHVILYRAGIPGFENLANLDQVPESGAYIVALPMKIEGGSGGPLRIVAFVPHNST